MTVIPARVAGVNEIFITTPPGKDMKINPATLAAAKIAGCNSVFKVGGPWGIAALAYGTETIPQVDKIVGPGNKYVTAAKMIVYGQVDIDSPAGPSEVLILADRSANPAWVALDFISQLEHDPDSAAVVVTTSPELAESLCTTIAGELESAPRKDIRGSLFLAFRNSQRWLHISWSLCPGARGRLCLRHQPRIAHKPVCADVFRPLSRRFSEKANFSVPDQAGPFQPQGRCDQHGRGRRVAKSRKSGEGALC